MFQFGYQIGSWNAANKAYNKLLGWPAGSDEAVQMESLAQFAAVVGSVIGSGCAGPML
jgi:hypothetical protein